MTDEDISVGIRGDSTQLVAAYKRATDAEEVFSGKAVSGGKGVELAAAKQKIAIVALEMEIKRLADAGEDVSRPVAALNAMTAAYNRNVEAAGRARAITADVQDQLKGATARAGEFKGQVGSLTDAIAVKFPDAADKIFGAVAALATFKEAFRDTRAVVDFVHKEMGYDIDDLVQKAIKIQYGFTGWFDETSRVGQESENLANRLNILRKNGIDPTGLSVAEVTKRVDELGLAMQRKSTKDTEFLGAFAKERASLDDSIGLLQKRVQAIEHGGEVTTQQADLIVAESKRQLDAIALLPADEQKAYATRKAALEGFIADYKGATTEYIANSEKVSATAHDLAEKEIAERQRVTAALKAEADKQIEILQKQYDDAVAAEQKANGGDSSGGDSGKQQARKETDELADSTSLFGQSLRGTNKELLANEKNLLGVGQATTSANERSRQAAEIVARRQDAENALNAALLKRSQLESEAETAAAIAATTYNETAVGLQFVTKQTHEVAGAQGDLAKATGKVVEGQLLITNTYEEQNPLIGQNAELTTTLSNAQGDQAVAAANAAEETGQLADLMEKYNGTAKEAHGTVEQGVNAFKDLHGAIKDCVEVAKELRQEMGHIADL